MSILYISPDCARFEINLHCHRDCIVCKKSDREEWKPEEALVDFQQSK